METRGLEPLTFCLQGRCNYQIVLRPQVLAASRRSDSNRWPPSYKEGALAGLSYTG